MVLMELHLNSYKKLQVENYKKYNREMSVRTFDKQPGSAKYLLTRTAFMEFK